MRRHWLSRAAAFIMGLAMIAAVLWGVRLLKQKMADPAPVGTVDRSDAAETMDTIVNGAYELSVITTQLSGKTYMSFEIYWLHGGASELWYACGRMFAADDVAAIRWANSNYDVEVKMKDGRSLIYSYNGNNEWTPPGH